MVLLCAVVVLPNWFAIQQYRATGGYLFYANAFDEPTYLSYDGAMITRSATRWSEYLVILLHKAGLSGGYINLLFDLSLPILAVVFLRRIGMLLQFSRIESGVYAVVIVATPVLFGYADPYYTRLYNLNYYSSGLSWITLPQGYYPPFFRTPEPQLSLALSAIATYVSLRWRSFIPAFVIVPVLYPFVAIPYAFVVLCLFIDQKLQTMAVGPGMRAGIALIVSFVAIACAKAAYYWVFVSGTGMADFLPSTRLPLLSFTGAAALLLYVVARTFVNPTLRRAGLFLAIAPLAAVNTQVISGFLEVPHNFEQNFGVVVLGVFFALVLSTIGFRPWPLVTAAVASCALLAVYSAHIFAVNGSVWQRMPPSQELLDGLRRQPDSVLIADPDLADVYSLIAPGVHFSALARSQTIRSELRSTGTATTADRFETYLCTKELVSVNRLSDAIPASTFSVLDQGFRYLNQDFPLVHLNRHTTFRQYFDPGMAPRHCTSRELLVFPMLLVGAPVHGVALLEDLTDVARWNRAEGGVLVTTSDQQWGYAAKVPIPPNALAVSDESVQMMDLRARMTVTKGCVGVGVLTHDEQQFVRAVDVSAADTIQTADVLFDPDPRGHWVVVRNCSPSGKSFATLGSVDLLPVHGVTVRSVRPVAHAAVQ